MSICTAAKITPNSAVSEAERQSAMHPHHQAGVPRRSNVTRTKP